MPRGVYVRRMTPAQRKSMAENLAKGREPKARRKAVKTLKSIAADPAWREKVGEATKEALSKPDVRERQLTGLRKYFAEHGSNFKGGNGQKPVAFVKRLAKVLEPQGYVREFVVRTAGHGTSHKPPASYKVDFGRPTDKSAIEVDGPSHNKPHKRRLDRKKQEVLESLGWTVQRIKH